MIKLSERVDKKVSRMITVVLCTIFLLFTIVFAILLAVRANSEGAAKGDLIADQIDGQLAEKVSFIRTVASGATTTNDYYAHVDNALTVFEDVSAVYVCIKDDECVYQDKIMTYMCGEWIPPEDFVVSDRAWYQGAVNSEEGYFISDPYVDEQSGSICITVAAPIMDGGEMIGVAGLDMYMDNIVSLIESSYVKNDYASLISTDGTILTSPYEELQPTAAASTSIADTKYAKAYENGGGSVSDYKGGFKKVRVIPLTKCDWSVIYVYSTAGIALAVVIAVLVMAIFGLIAIKGVSGQLVKTIDPLFAPLEDLSGNVNNILEGNLSYQFAQDDQSVEVHAVADALNSTISGLEDYIDGIANTVTEISNKNLNFEIDGTYYGDFVRIKESLERIMEVLNYSLSEINNQAETVRGFASNLSETSESVAESATVQSASVTDVSDEMDKLSANMEQIVGVADDIRENTEITSQKLQTSCEEMNELVASMEEISSCFTEISEFVSAINSIASQTNLLSLNASIEAARAGEAGRGFAVVAGEISSLSESSSSSAEKINEIIGKTTKAVENGAALVEKTKNSIDDSIASSDRNRELVQSITGVVADQKSSMEEIVSDIREITDMVQANAAAAEESSAISMQLNECATSLIDTVGEFRLRG
ncbi:MAG: methyl-accepting chemotaxis protein [Lachnospiraceae bacterium]|nr:methyl-accepting chemotaxis protein [Lachnospiraceae bacterium]